MTKLFAVVRRRGPAWQSGRPMEEQPDRRLHADFMNALAAEGFCRLAGPLEGSDEVLLAIRATDADALAARLADDPWSAQGLLETARIAPWDLRIGDLG